MRNTTTLIEETYEKRKSAKSTKEEKINDLKIKLDDVSQKMIKRAKSLNKNVLSTRKDPEILLLWNQLCQYHMQAISLCKSLTDQPKVCTSILRPLGCVEIMHLSDEETCCTRYLRKLDVHHPYW